MIKNQVVDSCRYLLRPLAQFLINQGVSFAEFTDIAKDAYVDAARRSWGIDGRPTNNARVAILTGISRREVARVRDRLVARGDDPAGRQGNRLSRILTGWHTDAEFLDTMGQPRALSEAGETGSFAALLKRYAGDLPRVAVRKELLKRGLIEALPDGTLRVLSRDFVFSTLDPDVVRQMGVALHDHAATLAHNLDDERSGERRLEGMADNAGIDVRHVPAFLDMLARRGTVFLQEIDNWLAAHETKAADAGTYEPVRLGVGIYAIHQNDATGLSK